MKKYFYLVATPESLLVSHLVPFDFGNYLAVGTKKQTRGQAVFFEIDPEQPTTCPGVISKKNWYLMKMANPNDRFISPSTVCWKIFRLRR